MLLVQQRLDGGVTMGLDSQLGGNTKLQVLTKMWLNKETNTEHNYCSDTIERD